MIAPTRPALLALLVLALGGCAARLPMDEPVNPQWEARRQVLAEIDQWRFTGSVSVRDGEQSQSSRIRWQQNSDQYRINLWGAFNAGATEIVGRPGRVRIDRRGEEPVVTDSPRQLIREQLGYDLPVQQLDRWVKGIPASDEPARTRFGDNNQLVSLRQDGWQIEYLAYSNFGIETLPTRIRLSRDSLQLDLLRLDWQVGEDADS